MRLGYRRDQFVAVAPRIVAREEEDDKESTIASRARETLERLHRKAAVVAQAVKVTGRSDSDDSTDDDDDIGGTPHAGPNRAGMGGPRHAGKGGGKAAPPQAPPPSNGGPPPPPGTTSSTSTSVSTSVSTTTSTVSSSSTTSTTTTTQTTSSTSVSTTTTAQPVLQTTPAPLLSTNGTPLLSSPTLVNSATRAQQQGPDTTASTTATTLVPPPSVATEPLASTTTKSMVLPTDASLGQTTQASTSGGTMSAASAAGIALGVIGGIGFLFVLSFFFWRRTWARKDARDAESWFRRRLTSLTGFTRRSNRSSAGGSSTVSDINVGRIGAGQVTARAWASAEEGRNSLDVGAKYYLDDKKGTPRSGNGAVPAPQPEPIWFQQLDENYKTPQPALLDEQALRAQEKQRNAKLRRNITSWLGRQRQQKMDDPAAARASYVSNASNISGGGQHKIRSQAVDLDDAYNISAWPLPMQPPPAPTDDKFDVASVDGAAPAPDRIKSLDPSALRGVAVPRSDAGGDDVSTAPVPIVRPVSAEGKMAPGPRKSLVATAGSGSGEDEPADSGGTAPDDVAIDAVKMGEVTTAKAVAIKPAEPETVQIESPRGSPKRSGRTKPADEKKKGEKQ